MNVCTVHLHEDEDLEFPGFATILLGICYEIQISYGFERARVLGLERCRFDVKRQI